MSKCNKAGKHEMLAIVKGLELCECSASGWLVNTKGAVEEARKLVEASGGFDAVRARINAEAIRLRKARAEDRADRQKKYMSAGRDHVRLLTQP